MVSSVLIVRRYLGGPAVLTDNRMIGTLVVGKVRISID